MSSSGSAGTTGSPASAATTCCAAAPARTSSRATPATTRSRWAATRRAYYDDEDGRHERAELGVGRRRRRPAHRRASGFDRLNGDAGNDVLRTGTGDDETLTHADVNGGRGRTDRIYGGPGNDF
jgi:Ca2+-binding RTX toxin-like protein